MPDAVLMRALAWYGLSMVGGVMFFAATEPFEFWRCVLAFVGMVIFLSASRAGTDAYNAQGREEMKRRWERGY